MNLIQPRVSGASNDALLVLFIKDEFRKALFQMHPDKASGHDGFNLSFSPKIFGCFGDGIYEAGISWFENGVFTLDLNDTIITIVPKYSEPATMKDLRSIALCNMVYKIMAKVLANRLKVYFLVLFLRLNGYLLKKGPLPIMF